jgi:hypothetical protein
MRRREFITLLSGAVATWPLGARAQQPKMPVIGFLNGGSPGGYAPYVTGFLHGPNEIGYVEVKTSRWITSGLPLHAPVRIVDGIQINRQGLDEQFSCFAVL